MNERVGVGVIGTSWFADLMHLPNLKNHPQAEIVAICGRNRSRAEEIAEKYAIPNVYTDYKEMTKADGVDAIVVITPDDTHYPMTMAALNAGRHVLCEKPLALTLVLAKEMYDTAEAIGVKHMTFFTYRWLPQYRYLKELVDDGYVGECYHINIQYMAGFGRKSSSHWAFDKKRSIGVLGNLGSHMVDLARWLVGDISKVSAHLGVFIDQNSESEESTHQANDAALLAVQFESGAQGSIHLSAVENTGGRGQEQKIVLCGESGTIEVKSSFIETEILGVQNGMEQFEELPIPERLLGDVRLDRPLFSQLGEVFTKQPVGDRLFIDSIVQDRRVTPSFYEGFKAQEVIDAAIESHENGRWISIG